MTMFPMLKITSRRSFKKWYLSHHSFNPPSEGWKRVWTAYKRWVERQYNLPVYTGGRSNAFPTVNAVEYKAGQTVETVEPVKKVA